MRRALYALTAAALACAFALTFTVSDYYIFNRISQFGAAFAASQWVKKGVLLLLPMAVFYRRRSCADAVKYFAPAFIVLSCCTFGDFFDITKVADTPAQDIYNAVNLFMPKWLNMARDNGVEEASEMLSMLGSVLGRGEQA